MKINMLRTITLIVLVLIGCFNTTAQDKHWLSYEPAIVELEGTVIVVRKYGLPNFGEQPKTDAKWRVPILVLTKPVNVRGNSEDVLNSESVEGLRRIQLSFYNLEISHKRFIGKRVRVKGTLFHAITGHQFTKVVINVDSIEVIKRR